MYCFVFGGLTWDFSPFFALQRISDYYLTALPNIAAMRNSQLQIVQNQLLKEVCIYGGVDTGGGGGALPILTVMGTCRWTGYNFPVINIDTGYLNRPNWLLAGYSVYWHRVASQPTMFMTGPISRHQRRCVRDATDFEFFISFYCKRTIGQGISEVCNIAKGYAYASF